MSECLKLLDKRTRQVYTLNIISYEGSLTTVDTKKNDKGQGTSKVDISDLRFHSYVQHSDLVKLSSDQYSHLMFIYFYD